MNVQLHHDALRAAQASIRPFLHRTPLVRSSYLSAHLDAEVYLKLENQQKTGSFKPRGALVSLLGLDAAERKRGAITISAGNHAQGLAFAGRALGVPVTVVMPEGASRIKVEATRGYGAEVIQHGDIHAAFAKLDELREARDLVLIHPFDSLGAILGQATVGAEIFEDLAGTDYLLAGVGGGGLISGLALAAHLLRPATKVIGVEPLGADSLYRSLELGRPVRLERTSTIADGLAAPFTGAINFEVCQEGLQRVERVTDEEILAGMRVLLERVKTLAEPAGAAAVGALLSGRIEVPPGSRVVAVVSGGNIGAAELARAIL